jgi:hypothetical protein
MKMAKIKFRTIKGENNEEQKIPMQMTITPKERQLLRTDMDWYRKNGYGGDAAGTLWKMSFEYLKDASENEAGERECTVTVQPSDEVVEPT